ncbi:MAG: PHP domain-containing protein, partial [Myxococcota bacterium]
LTDHDEVRGLGPAQAHARELDLELVGGIEISICEHGGRRQLHVLGLDVDARDPGLRAFCERQRASRWRRAEQMVERLAGAGISIAMSDVLRVAGKATLGRPHMARALVACGACADFESAFRRWLRRGKPAWVCRETVTAEEAIDAIHTAGGVAILAHPPHSDGVDADGGLEAFVSRLVPLGLDGIEVWHPNHSPRQRARLRALATRLDLLETGGSDFHGSHRPGIELGSGRGGNVRVGVECLTRLRSRAPDAASRAERAAALD